MTSNAGLASKKCHQYIVADNTELIEINSNNIKRRETHKSILLRAVEEKKFICGISRCEKNACYSDDLSDKGYKVFEYPQAGFRFRISSRDSRPIKTLDRASE